MPQLRVWVPSLVLVAVTLFAAGDGARVDRVHRRSAAPIVSIAANQSSNWSGYNQGLLEKDTPFTSVGGTWTVPTATQHTRGQEEFSSVWVGVGGGCLETSCVLTDPTLIQAGTEQDVDAAGNATYSAWWEIIPVPAIAAPLAVHAGDVVSVRIAQAIPLIWSIEIHNRTTGQSFSTTVPYPSIYGTAEWIVETPLVLATSGAGVAAMPNLSRVALRELTANGSNPHLTSDEALQLVQGEEVIATPSAPSGGNAFDVCTYSAGC